MDAKQLTELGRQLIKASDESSSNLLQLLSPLQKFTATEDLLRQSKIGVAVNKLRQHKDPKVAQMSGALINKWKQDVNKSKKAKTGSPAPAARVAKGAKPGTSSPAPGGKMEGVKTENSKRKSNVAPEKRSAKADQINCKVSGDQGRDGCIELLYNGLAFMSDEAPEDILAVARRVEVAAFDDHKHETSMAYKEKMRSLFLNLKLKPNVDLRRDVFSGKIPPGKFVKMTDDELKHPEKRKEEEKLQEENMRVAMTAQEERAISTTMTCGKCKQSKVAYSQAQTRSADEPMTTFCECVNCGNRWKFS
ncbi:transcription elongation factor S-II [Teratosphaeria nubilosa]|uniref:Transcription elongation factor n=1 Tax=Teratosphaeria nubilosa TaxID=161662 RepID=A0A6G1KVG1_9PEZI|nr:transcription elongation factor S-II [Teratosphaeria nubilosa]